MVALLANLLTLSSIAYESTLVFERKNADGFGVPYVAATVLTDDGLVAGYWCDVVGIHGETGAGHPFVWDKGKVIELPTGKGRYGHVWAGGKDVLVGDSDIERHLWPAKWTPDPTSGWANPKLEAVAREPGRAIFAAANGDFWAETRRDTIRIRGGNVRRFRTGPFFLSHVDDNGWLYGTRYEGQGGEGGYRFGPPAKFDGGIWLLLHPKGEKAKLNAVNSRGLAVGQIGNRAAVWQSGKSTIIGAPEFRGSSAEWVNDEGLIGGYFWMKGKGLRACLWRDRKIENLSGWIPTCESSVASRVNNRGWVAVEARFPDAVRIYLLKPK